MFIESSQRNRFYLFEKSFPPINCQYSFRTTFTDHWTVFGFKAIFQRDATSRVVLENIYQQADDSRPSVGLALAEKVRYATFLDPEGGSPNDL